MKPEKQRIAIAEACPDIWQDRGFIWSNQGFLVHPFNQVIIDPLNDLNAMHEAEKVLNTAELMDLYWRELSKIIGFSRDFGTNFDLVHATAAQRAEAFLKTIGKWEDDA